MEPLNTNGHTISCQCTSCWEKAGNQPVTQRTTTGQVLSGTLCQCHPACACREKKVQELVEAAYSAMKQLESLDCPAHAKTLGDAIEGVKS